MSASHVRIHFPLVRDEDGYPPADRETLWARASGDGHYTLDNTPFFARGVSSGDVVAAVEQTSGDLVFAGLVAQGGHRTVRIVCDQPEAVARVRDAVARMGCKSEQSHIATLVAVDVPPEVSSLDFLKFLEEAQAAGLLNEWEEGSVDW